MTTHVLLVNDVSGSMDALAGDVRSGYNAYVADLRADTEATYSVTAVLFNHEYEALCVGASLDAVPELTHINYRPRGFTALLDAVGRAIADFESSTVLADDDRVLLVVQTDGAENSSREYSREQVAEMIRTREAAGRWTCLFLGAGIDAWSQAGALGFAAANTVSTAASGAGTRSTYAAVTQTTRAYARGADAASVSGLIAEAANTEGTE